MNELVPVKRLVRWRLLIAYDGTSYAGWQEQDGPHTVEGALKSALFRLIGRPVSVRVAGRTDAGVHARGQVVSCQLESRFAGDKLVLALGTVLPKTISVLRADEMPEGFDAKRQAVGKRYVYRIHQGLARDPFRDAIAWHIRAPLDLAAMREAAKHLVGELDFETFRSANCEAEHARRTLWYVGVESKGEGLEIDVRGNAFCQHMVRIIVGTLVGVGRRQYSPDDVKQMLAAKKREAAGMTAPAKGLTLDTVYYPDDLSDALIPPHAQFPRYPVTTESWGFKKEEILLGAQSCSALA